ncbi:MAG: 6-phosphofructokinase, partial [Flavobacteriales bacterium]
MNKIAVLTSGGDAPGMNACIRAVVRTAVYKGAEVIGINRGYNGLVENDFVELKSFSVANILQKGGTILKSARSESFMTKKGRKSAFENLKNAGIEGVIAIGGDGTFTGAHIFNQEYNIPFIGIPGTIDNDLYGTDETIGYDTALNTVVDCVDKIRDTASSHNRLFFVEVMGKDAGFIALRSGIGIGAEAVLVPETKTYVDKLIAKLESGRRKSKTSGIVIVAEGDDAGGAFEIARKVKEKFDFYDTRVSVLGHLQRGGKPSARDRVLASQLGFSAVESLLAGNT